MLKIIALFLPFFGMGQNLFLYSYKFFPNNQQKSANEMTMALKLDTKKSLFCPLEYLTSDEEDFIKKYFTNIEIVKNQNDSQVTAFIPLESEMYEVALPNNLIVWKIHSERKNILGHEVIKATTLFGDIQWTAWFSNELSGNDGPYIFKGLPGIILEAYDEKQEHHFTIKEISNNNEDFSVKQYIRPAIPTSLKELKNKWIHYQKDPIKEIRLSLLNSPNQIQMFHSDGTPLLPQEIIRMKEQEAKQILKENNNHINLFLLKQ